MDRFRNSTSYNQDDQLIRDLITDTEIINHLINKLSFDLYQENITNANEIIQTISNGNESTQNTESNLETQDSQPDLHQLSYKQAIKNWCSNAADFLRKAHIAFDKNDINLMSSFLHKFLDNSMTNVTIQAPFNITMNANTDTTSTLKRVAKLLACGETKNAMRILSSHGVCSHLNNE